MRRSDWPIPIASQILLAGVVVPILVLLSIIWWPYQPLKIHKIDVLNSQVVSGAPIEFRITYTKYTDKPAKIITQLINDRVVYYTPIESNVPIGYGSKIVSLPTSIGDMPGKYMMRRTYVYTYFGFWEVSVVGKSPWFQIVSHTKE